MSLARDDIGISRALDALHTEFIKSRTLEKSNDSPKTSGSDTEPEICDVFEKNSTEKERNVEELQEDYNSLEVKKEALKEIDASLEHIDASGEDIEEEDVEEIREAINEIVSQENSSVEEEDVEKAELTEEANRRINKLRAEVNEKQQQIAQEQKKLYDEVSSVVELHISVDDSSEETIEQQAEDLKQSVVKEIKENPEISRQMQITRFDKNMILAMISLRK